MVLSESLTNIHQPAAWAPRHLVHRIRRRASAAHARSWFRISSPEAAHAAAVVFTGIFTGETWLGTWWLVSGLGGWVDGWVGECLMLVDG